MSKPAIEEPVARLGRLEVEVEELRHQVDLARAVAERRGRDYERLERKISTLQLERDAFRRQFEERNRLLAVILQSRSFRWMQSLRRALGRE